MNSSLMRIRNKEARAKDRHAKREFESHFGKKIPKYRLERFLDKLTSASHSGPETEEACE